MPTGVEATRQADQATTAARRLPSGVRRELAHVQLLDAREVATLLRISPATLWRCVKDERIPAPIRFGPRLVRWRLRDLERFIGEEGRP